MACTNEKNRADDKYTAWESAWADQTGATAALAVAEAAALVACPFFWTGFGTAACATALTAVGTAAAAVTATALKTKAAKDAYQRAFQAYQGCLAKCKKK
jgi:hypothetical protein